MADTVVIPGDDDAGGPSTPEQSAHEAAVAEGATAVHTENAQEAAAEAQAAAAVALAAAEANIESGAAVEQAAEQAGSSAAVASVSAEMVHEALTAQTAAINALAEELKAARTAGPKEDKPPKPAADRAPDRKIPAYYR